MSWSLPVPVAPSPAQEAEFPALGFVPCPGDPPTATRVAALVRGTATSLEDICHLLNGTGQGREWRGRSADAFREEFHEDFRPKVERARDSFQLAADALEEWSSAMDDFQRRAGNLEREAQEAQDALNAAQGSLDALPEPSGGAAPRDEDAARAAEETAAERATAEHQVATAQERLDDARERARRLAEDYVESGEEIADRLRHAMDIAPNRPGWLSGFADFLGGVCDAVVGIAGSILADIAQWVAEHAEQFRIFGDICSYMSMGLGIAAVALALVPGGQLVAAGLSTASAGFALAALAAHGVAAAGGADVSPRTFMQDALGVAPFGAAFRAGGRLSRIGTSWGAEALSSLGLLDSIMSNVQNLGTRQPAAQPPEGDAADGESAALMRSFDQEWEAQERAAAGSR